MKTFRNGKLGLLWVGAALLAHLGCAGRLEGGSAVADSTDGAPPASGGNDASTTSPSDPGSDIDGGTSDFFPLGGLMASGGSIAQLTLGGTFSHLPTDFVEGVGFIEELPASAGAKTRFTAVFSSKPGIASRQLEVDEHMLFVVVQSVGATLTTDTFPDPAKNTVGKGNVEIDSFWGSTACGGSFEGDDSGSVVITEVTSTYVAGTFSINVSGGWGETLTGQFKVPIVSGAPQYGTCLPPG